MCDASKLIGAAVAQERERLRVSTNRKIGGSIPGSSSPWATVNCEPY